MRTTLKTLRLGMMGAGCLLVAGASALAQSAGTPAQPGAGMDGKVTGAGSGSSATGSNAVETGQGGVGGTGMGKMPMQTDQPGTGQSVKGQAGQSITNSTDSAKKTP